MTFALPPERLRAHMETWLRRADEASRRGHEFLAGYYLDIARDFERRLNSPDGSPDSVDAATAVESPRPA